MGVDELAGPSPFAGGCLNYLHFGDSLAALAELLRRSEPGGDAVEGDLVARLRTPGGARDRGVADAADVLRAVAGPGGRVSLARLRHDVEMSLRLARGVPVPGLPRVLLPLPRGPALPQLRLFLGGQLHPGLVDRAFDPLFRNCVFSSEVSCAPGLVDRAFDPLFRNCVFSSEVSLKVALIADRDLYYPPKVRHGLPAAEPMNRHISHAIGWLLVKEKSFEGQRWWYVINVQSDLMSVPVSCLKEIFRGWQRVLFRLVIGMAQQRGVAALAMPSAALMADSGAVRLAPMLDGAEDVARKARPGVAGTL